MRFDFQTPTYYGISGRSFGVSEPLCLQVQNRGNVCLRESSCTLAMVNKYKLIILVVIPRASNISALVYRALSL